MPKDRSINSHYYLKLLKTDYNWLEPNFDYLIQELKIIKNQLQLVVLTLTI